MKKLNQLSITSSATSSQLGASHRTWWDQRPREDSSTRRSSSQHSVLKWIPKSEAMTVILWEFLPSSTVREEVCSARSPTCQWNLSFCSATDRNSLPLPLNISCSLRSLQTCLQITIWCLCSPESRHQVYSNHWPPANSCPAPRSYRLKSQQFQ